MKLLVLTEYFPKSETDAVTGGVELRALNLLRELAKRHQVTVICSYQGGERIQKIAGIDVMRVGMVSPYASVGNIIPRLVYAGAAFITGLLLPKHDVVDGYSYLNYPVASLLGRIKNSSVVLTYHESWSVQEWIKLKGWFTGTLGSIWSSIARLLPYDRIIAVSTTTKQRLAEQGMRKVSVVYNGIDTHFVRSIPAKHTASGIVCAARLIASKRIDLLVAAVAELRRQIPDISCTILGDGPEHKTLQQLIAKHRLQKHVRIITKPMAFAEHVRIMKRHVVMCLPSDVEGFGMAVVAGMAAGLPVVCSDIPVLREVTNNQGALHFRAGNAHDLATQLRTLLTDKSVHARKRTEALARARRFEWSSLGIEAEKVYRGVL